MPRSPEQLRSDLFAIWQAGVDAVRSERLVREQVRVEGDWLHIGDDSFDLRDVRRIVVVGAGKAGAGMAAGLEQALGPRLLQEKQVKGWANVPADCVRSLSHIHLHAARPAGVNEPTAAGVAGAEKILELARSVGPHDLLLCLISGGGSALLPLPAPGITLADKLQVTRALSAAGANIRELNTVRKHLSGVKGGRLAAAARRGKVVSLIISDVLGDPLDLIASGPTVRDLSTPADALVVLRKFLPQRTVAEGEAIPSAVWKYLEQQARLPQPDDVVPTATNLIIGNNATAVDAAGIEAERRGYSHAMIAATELEGAAEEIGRHHARLAQSMRAENGPDCLISGGEPVVTLAPAAIRGRGGRNQQLALAAFNELGPNGWEGIALLSGGTDGEDGPTDAAGAFVDAEIAAAIRQQKISAAEYLQRNDAYTFFSRVGGLVKTGPTHTNVCDLRVVVVDRIEARPPL